MSQQKSENEAPSTATTHALHDLLENISQVLHEYFRQNPMQPGQALYDHIRNEVEITLLMEVLQKVRFNLQNASKILGISRSTLRKRINQYGLHYQYTLRSKPKSFSEL